MIGSFGGQITPEWLTKVLQRKTDLSEESTKTLDSAVKSLKDIVTPAR